MNNPTLRHYRYHTHLNEQESGEERTTEVGVRDSSSTSWDLWASVPSSVNRDGYPPLLTSPA